MWIRRKNIKKLDFYYKTRRIELEGKNSIEINKFNKL